MNDFSNPQNKELYAVVSVGYNRLKSQKRLLESLLNADYTGYSNVPLIISIDCSGDEELYEYAHNFKWPHGDKYVIIRGERLGLKEHILSCGDLTKFFKGIVLLEDDLFVSRWYYQYVMQMEDAYGNTEKVASIGLYSNEMNGFCWLPFDRLSNGSDVYAIQSVCTWGEAWNTRMWEGFREWYLKAKIDWQMLDVPEAEKGWGQAWSKFFDAYLVMNDRYSIFPNISLATNFSDAGEHSSNNNEGFRFQSSLQYGERKYQALSFNDLLKYDAHFNSLNLFDSLCLKREDVCVDLYGNRDNFYNKRYCLSVKPRPYKVIKCFGLSMRPIEMNVINDIRGYGIFLYDTSVREKKPKGMSTSKKMMYYQKGFNSMLLWPLIKGNMNFVFFKVFSKLKKKMGKLWVR